MELGEEASLLAALCSTRGPQQIGRPAAAACCWLARGPPAPSGGDWGQIAPNCNDNNDNNKRQPESKRPALHVNGAGLLTGGRSRGGRRAARASGHNKPEAPNKWK